MKLDWVIEIVCLVSIQGDQCDTQCRSRSRVLTDDPILQLFLINCRDLGNPWAADQGIRSQHSIHGFVMSDQTGASIRVSELLEKHFPAFVGIGTDSEVKTLFTELRDEELEHVEMLRAEMAKLPSSASVAAEYDPDDAPYL